MTADGHASVSTYLKVWGWLAVLTAVEIGVVFLPIPHRAIVAALLVLAAAKAALVAFFFMHLKFDGKLIRFVGLSPLLFVWILLIYVMGDFAALAGSGEMHPPAPAATEPHHD